MPTRPTKLVPVKVLDVKVLFAESNAEALCKQLESPAPFLEALAGTLNAMQQEGLTDQQMIDQFTLTQDDPIVTADRANTGDFLASVIDGKELSF